MAVRRRPPAVVVGGSWAVAKRRLKGSLSVEKEESGRLKEEREPNELRDGERRAHAATHKRPVLRQSPLVVAPTKPLENLPSELRDKSSRATFSSALRTTS